MRVTKEEVEENLGKNIGVSTLENTFENFLPEKGTEKALKACQALASGKTKWNMLLIYGGVGNGKTHLLLALGIEMGGRGIFCRMLAYPEMMRFLKGCMNKNSSQNVDTVMDLWLCSCL